MSLDTYFDNIIKKVEASNIGNNGTDNQGFFKPTRTVILRHLRLLKDLHDKPLAKGMVQNSWDYVMGHLPPEWLVLDDEQKKELKEILQ
jgi:hypothetical protein